MMWFLLMTAAMWLYYTTFFCLIQKPVFALGNRSAMPSGTGASAVWQVYRHGVVSDAIISSYLSAIPIFTGMVYTMAPCFSISVVMGAYNAVTAIAIGLLVVSDTALYRFWQSKIDASVFTYLRSLKGAFASVSTAYIVTALVAVALVASLFFAGAQTLTSYLCQWAPRQFMPWWGYPAVPAAFALGVGILFIIIRGFKIRPNNPSVVYFSNKPFYNHWALNPAYNIIYSLTTKDEFKGKFAYFTEERRKEIMDGLFPTAGTPARRLFKTDRPNILLIIWESFGAEFSEALGGRPDVARNFDRLVGEGVLFTRCRAGSFRTDRGLVCLLSGYLGQPTTSIIRYNRKIVNLPGLPRTLRREGYETTAVHGGDLTIMHKSEYYLASGHDTLVSQKDMPKSAPTCKWGIDDGYMFDVIHDDIMQKSARGARWFTTFQTLSSHEPFKVPYSRLDDEVDNSFAYTDHCLGQLIDRLKATPAWDNIVVAVVADHGLNRQGARIDHAENSHIPLLLLGGALKDKGIAIDTLMSQTDLAATLLGQMDIDHSDFTFSRDILADTYTRHFSLHSYSNGFVLTDSRGTTDFDNVADRAVAGADTTREAKGKAILQTLYEDLANK